MSCTLAGVKVQFIILCSVFRNAQIMRKVLNYFFLAVGAVILVSVLALVFGFTSRVSYEIFFGIETTKIGYIAYKLVLGTVLVLVSLMDLRKAK